MKIMVMYLPQYHRIKENDEWWEPGYTEWTAVKRAQPLYQNHIQPKIPLNDNYYDLSDTKASTWKWQAYLANKYGIYGFCIYHYWFETGSQLLEKPMEILLEHPEIDIRYCVCWANETWTRTWYDLNEQILKKQKYGNISDWKDHFNYLLKFFRDKRYIKIDNKPMIHIHRTFEIKKMAEMREVWETLAQINGFSGIYIVSGNTFEKIDNRAELFDAYYNFEPSFTFRHVMDIKYKIFYIIRRSFIQFINFFRGKKKLERLVNAKWIYKNNRKKAEINSKNVF